MVPLVSVAKHSQASRRPSSVLTYIQPNPTFTICIASVCFNFSFLLPVELISLLSEVFTKAQGTFTWACGHMLLVIGRGTPLSNNLLLSLTNL